MQSRRLTPLPLMLALVAIGACDAGESNNDLRDGALAVDDPRVRADDAFAAGRLTESSPALREALERWSHLDAVLPALGYGEEQLAALEQTLNDVDAEVIVSGTPLDLSRLVSVDKPIVRARYAYAETGPPTLGDAIDAFLTAHVRSEE